jgi:hypothetical protein
MEIQEPQILGVLFTIVVAEAVVLVAQVIQVAVLVQAVVVQAVQELHTQYLVHQ